MNIFKKIFGFLDWNVPTPIEELEWVAPFESKKPKYEVGDLVNIEGIGLYLIVRAFRGCISNGNMPQYGLFKEGHSDIYLDETVLDKHTVKKFKVEDA